MSMTLRYLQKLMEPEAKEKKIPLSGGFEITPRCNLNCVMCYVRKHPADLLAIEKEMSADQIISIARQARDMGMLYILLTGGEILVRKDFKYIYEEICKLGLIVTLFTNGTLITQEWVDWIATMPPTKISITMYGASPDTYEKVTGNRSAYYLVIQAIDMLLERGIKVELKTTWIKRNVDDYYQLLEFAESKGLRLKVGNYIYPIKQDGSSNPEDLRLDPEDLAQKEMEIAEHAFQRTSQKPEENISNEPIEIDETIKANGEVYNGAFRCNAGINTFWLSWRGEILPCAVMSEPSVKVDSIDFRKSWVELIGLTSEVPVCQGCNKCNLRKYCMTCPARLFAESDSFTKPANYLCELTRKQMKFLNKLLF